MTNQLVKSVRIGIAGVGTVGTSMVNILHDRCSAYEQQLGVSLVISRVALRRVNAPRNCDLKGVSVGTDVMALAHAEDVDIVVELIGDMASSLALVRQSILNGKSVVTANKALLAVHGDELFALSREKKVPLLFEAAVGSGIPIIKMMRESLVANRVYGVAGIVNGTCNYLLTRMSHEGMAYANVLADAKQLGYAEADPTFDVEGVDAAHKVALLGRLCFGQSIDFSAIKHYGLADIHAEDFKIVKKMGYVIKPMGMVKKSQAGIEAYVFPALVTRSTLMSRIDGVTNIVQVFADRVGCVSCVGPGAGGESAASAMVADVVELAYAIRHNRLSSVFMPFLGDRDHRAKMIPFGDTQHTYYLRFQMQDRPGMMKQCASILEDLDISIEVLNQEEPKEGEDRVNVALITNKVAEKIIQKAYRKIVDLPGCVKHSSLIRVFHSPA